MTPPKPISYDQIRSVEPKIVYKPDLGRTDTTLRQSGVMVVINQDHVKTAEHLVTTMWEVYQAGMIPEVVMRFKESYNKGLVTEAMTELRDRRSKVAQVIKDTGEGRYLILSTGSITDDEDLELAKKLDFDIGVGPDLMATSRGNPLEVLSILKTYQDQGYAMGPGILIPLHLKDLLVNEVGFRPTIIKEFPAGIPGPKQTDALLAP